MERCAHVCVERERCCRCRGYSANCAVCVLSDPESPLLRALDEETDGRTR